MKTVRINTSKEYDVHIGKGLLDSAGKFIKETGGNIKTAAIVTDDIVEGLYLKRLTASLAAEGYKTFSITFRNGESSKNTGSYIKTIDLLSRNRVLRSDAVIALGGGVVGDIAGFAAATYLRGVRFFQIPTTLLAAVDSSVGGKTGIDLATGKNLVGAFYQPDAVLCDIETLKSQPPRVFTDGCAEVIKYGVIADEVLFNKLPADEEKLEEIIARCVEIKRDVVCEDEFEKDTRMLLNFGHTIGHAVEVRSGYAISHGAAVAIGMAVITLAAANMGWCGIDCYHALCRMLDAHGLPKTTVYSAQELARTGMADKKRAGDMITLVIPERIGKCVLRSVEADKLESIVALGLKKN